MGYLAHFGLKRAPFSTTPDPEFAYATREHQLAIAKTQYVVDERQGFFLLQSDNSTGKTTISEFLLNNWREDKSLAVAYLPNPADTPSQFLRLLLSAYGQAHPGSNRTAGTPSAASWRQATSRGGRPCLCSTRPRRSAPRIWRH